CAPPAVPIPPLHVDAVAAAEAFLRRTRPTPSRVPVNLVSAAVLPSDRGAPSVLHSATAPGDVLCERSSRFGGIGREPDRADGASAPPCTPSHGQPTSSVQPSDNLPVTVNR